MRDKKGKFVKGTTPWNKGTKGTSVITDKHISKQKRKHGLNWKGGKTIHEGRLLKYQPAHPNSNKKGYVRNSHLVVEKYLGRFLTKDEVVHHLDEDKLNDELCNLYLFPNKSEHCRFHGNQYQRKNPEFIAKQKLLKSNLL